MAIVALCSLQDRGSRPKKRVASFLLVSDRCNSIIRHYIALSLSSSVFL
jgi:hypothetical protein